MKIASTSMQCGIWTNEMGVQTYKAMERRNEKACKKLGKLEMVGGQH